MSACVRAHLTSDISEVKQKANQCVLTNRAPKQEMRISLANHSSANSGFKTGVQLRKPQFCQRQYFSETSPMWLASNCCALNSYLLSPWVESTWFRFVEFVSKQKLKTEPYSMVMLQLLRITLTRCMPQNQQAASVRSFMHNRNIYQLRCIKWDLKRQDVRWM